MWPETEYDGSREERELSPACYMWTAHIRNGDIATPQAYYMSNGLSNQ